MLEGARGTLARAIRMVREHPSVYSVVESSSGASVAAILDVTFRVNLPNAWMAVGASPNGVRAHETVRLTFPKDFPLHPPAISLRFDFDRNLPHIQPLLEDGHPVPCVFDGSLSELLHHRGLQGVLNQIAIWLDRAALGQLIDPSQGWEPVRRDELDDFVVADAARLRAQVAREASYKFFEFDYVRFVLSSRQSFVHGEIADSPFSLNNRTAAGRFSEETKGKNFRVSIGHSLAIVATPGKLAGDAVIAGRYSPEDVHNVEALMTRAGEYGCGAPLREALSWLKGCVRDRSSAGPFAVAIVLMARRPLNVIGTDSPMELCPYIVDIELPGVFESPARTSLRPAGHRDRIAPALLHRLAGEESLAPKPWTLLGCGSLGSKIAIHRARSGAAPRVVVDKASMTPHNAARHALLPPSGPQFLWTDSKASLLVDAMRGFGATATPLRNDIVDLVGDTKSASELSPLGTWAIVNATASLSVREALASSHRHLRMRVVECSLFARGRIGLVTIEGAERTPDTGDLISETYRLLSSDPDLAPLMADETPPVARARTGEGCGSLTMIMPDARISLFAASMSETIALMQQSAEEKGTILLGLIADDLVSLVWKRHEVEMGVRIQTAGADSWQVHIGSLAAEKITDEIARWPAVETGGILMGRLSEAARTFYVVDVLQAPPDSVRSSTCFTIGTVGIRREISRFAEASNWSLYCLGTWHSHLQPGGASGLDRATAQAVSLARLAPSILLIHTPTGYESILAAEC